MMFQRSAWKRLAGGPCLPVARAAGPALSLGHPNRAVAVIVPWSEGGGADTLMDPALNFGYLAACHIAGHRW